MAPVGQGRRVILKCPRNCGGEIPRGKITCVLCGAVAFGPPKTTIGVRPDDGIKRLSELQTMKLERIVTGFADRNFGPAGNEGVAVSAVTMLGGMPGAGKSTLILQILSNIAKATGRPALLVGAEESGEQVKDRALRLEIDNLADILILPLEEQVAGHKLTRETFERWNPSALAIDSLQKCSDSDDDAVKLCEDLKEISVIKRCPVFVVSQVNKEDEFAGSNKAQHAVDALVIFSLADELMTADGRILMPPPDPEQPDKIEPFRALRTSKNRFGDSYESYFTMHRTGLRPFVIPTPEQKRRKK